MKYNRISPRNVLLAIAIAVAIYWIATCTTSKYSVEDQGFPIGAEPAAEKPATNGTEEQESAPNCEMKAGTGLASSLLPKEIASQEDFAEVAPEDVLAGQNFLEPRQQIGFPETVGGAMRNGNQQVRADPPNPKEPFVWNNSTIAPDTMRRPLC